MTTDTTIWTGYLPTTSPETEPFWAAANEGVLLLQKCQDCGQVQYHYRALCSTCMSDRLDDLPSSGLGTVWTFSVVHRNNSAGYSEKVPYVVAVVELEGGVKVITNIVSAGATDVTFGTPVALTFAKGDNGQMIPLFKVA